MDIAVVLHDEKAQVFSREQPLCGNQAGKTLPIVGHEDVCVNSDVIEQPSTGLIITPTQFLGQGSPCHRDKGRQIQTGFFSIDDMPPLVNLHDPRR